MNYPSWGSRNTPSRFKLLKPVISAGLMGHLAHMQTLYYLTLYWRKRSLYFEVIVLSKAFYI